MFIWFMCDERSVYLLEKKNYTHCAHETLPWPIYALGTTTLPRRIHLQNIGATKEHRMLSHRSYDKVRKRPWYFFSTFHVICERLQVEWMFITRRNVRRRHFLKWVPCTRTYTLFSKLFAFNRCGEHEQLFSDVLVYK